MSWTKIRMKDDPVEDLVARGLSSHGIAFERNTIQSGREVDFYLPKQNLAIEVCQFYTPRKDKVLQDLPNVIIIQGLEAAASFLSVLTHVKTYKEDMGR